MSADEDPTPAGDLSAEDMDTAKHQRSALNFAETDAFGEAPAQDPPPPGSLAAWLAKNQQAASAEPQQPLAGRLHLANQWWICCDPLPPIPLGSKTATITIGRSRAADVVLPHTQVSRVHGKIQVKGEGQYVYEDNGSANGSILNGERTATAELKVGDVINVGPYEIEIHDTKSLRGRTSTETDQGDAGDMTRVFSQTPQAAMTGRLNEVPISEILQGLEYNRKTGTLEIESRAGRGRLIVAEGHPIQASFAKLYHDEALITMAGLQEGHFQFSANVEPAEPMFRSTITALLLEAARRVDENR